MHQESSTRSNGGLKRSVPEEEHCLGQYSTIFLLICSSISGDTMKRLKKNHINLISLEDVETSTKHLKYSLGLSKLIFQLFQVYCIHILMIHSNNQTNLSQTLSKTIFKSSFIVTTVKNWICFEFIAICDHCGFWGLQICNIEILLGKDKLSSCRNLHLFCSV